MAVDIELTLASINFLIWKILGMIKGIEWSNMGKDFSQF